MSQHSVQAAVACRNCGAAPEGSYRHEFGEPRSHEHELSVRHAIHDAVRVTAFAWALLSARTVYDFLQTLT